MFCAHLATVNMARLVTPARTVRTVPTITGQDPKVPVYRARRDNFEALLQPRCAVTRTHICCSTTISKLENWAAGIATRTTILWAVGLYVRAHAKVVSLVSKVVLTANA